MDKKKSTRKSMNFEGSLNELEKIAERLEGSELGLEESIKEFEKGMNYARFCNEKLEEAEKKIMILQKGDDGKIKDKEIKIKGESGDIDDDIQGSLL